MKSIDYFWLKGRAIAWLVLGRSSQAHSLFDTMVQRWPQDTYALASRAHLLAQAGQHELALIDSQQLLVLSPENARTWFNHGFMLEAAGRWDDALAAFARATQLSPELDRAWYGQGLVLIRLQRYEEAIQALKRTTELQPMSPHGWYQLARVHVDQKNPLAAAKIIQHLKGFEPKVAAQLERETGLIGMPAAH